MKKYRANRARHPEEGVALLISIFILLLISVVAIALLVSSGTEQAIAGNYRDSTSVNYAALAGLEEARSRLLPTDQSSFKSTWAAFYPARGTALQVGHVGYMLNPGPADAANTLTTYPDNEYSKEFSTPPTTVSTTRSVWQRNPLNALPYPGPLYKWVRINAVSEKSLNLDVDADGRADSTTPLYYDVSNPASPRFSNNSGNGSLVFPQIFEITSLAVLPNRSQKLLQYLVASQPLNLSFPAALTLDGNNITQFTVPTSSNFWVDGRDHGSVGGCNPGGSASTAVGYTNKNDPSQANIVAAIPHGPAPSPDLRNNYTNSNTPPNPPAADVNWITLNPDLTTVSGLNALVQAITQSADVVINRNATASDMPSAMSSSNPMTVVVNGDLNLNGWRSTGYGLLLVTGKFTFDPGASWNGIILMIGKGWIFSNQGGSGQLQGAVFLATTVDATNNPLPPGAPLGSPFFDFTPSSGSAGVYYSSCWVQAAMPDITYKILAFHEIPCPTLGAC